VKVVVLVAASSLALGLGSCGKSEKSLERNPPLAPNWAEQQGFSGNKEAERGAEIFAQVGCLNCHSYLGDGTPNLGAPDLTAIGTQSPRTIEGYANYVSNPSDFGNQVMPKFRDLGRRKLLAVGAFLEASKGER